MREGGARGYAERFGGMLCTRARLCLDQPGDRSGKPTNNNDNAYSNSTQQTQAININRQTHKSSTHTRRQIRLSSGFLPGTCWKHSRKLFGRQLWMSTRSSNGLCRAATSSCAQWSSRFVAKPVAETKRRESPLGMIPVGPAAIAIASSRNTTESERCRSSGAA